MPVDADKQFRRIVSGAFVSGFAGAIVALIVVANVAAVRPTFFDTIFGVPKQSPVSDSVLSEEARTVDVARRVSPAVVSVVISKDVPVIEQGDPLGMFFDFWGDSPLVAPRVPQSTGKTERKEIGGGSGFFVSSDGLLVTNRHVVDDEAAEYTVLTNDGKKHSARVVAKDTYYDVAIMKVAGGPFPFLSFGDSGSIEVGQRAIAIGNALGEFRNTVSVGVISGLSRSITAGDGFGKTEHLEEVIQTDAAINPGNSGGPLLNLRGEVIGVNVAVAQGSQSIGFALPADVVSRVVSSVKTTGKIVYPYLGVRFVPITSDFAKEKNLSVEYGVYVRAGERAGEPAVLPGSPADRAGIREGDIILSVDGRKLEGDVSLVSIVRGKKVGDQVWVELLRGAQRLTHTVILAEMPN